MTTTPSRASGERSSDSCDAPSPIGDSLLRETQSTTIKALAEMVRLCMPDHLPDKVGDLEIIPREPVMEQVTRIRGAWDKVSLYLAQHPQSVGAPVSPEPNGEIVGWWNGIRPDGTDRSPYGPSVRWGADKEDRAHKHPLYDGYNPIHYKTPDPRERNEGGGDAVATLTDGASPNDDGDAIGPWFSRADAYRLRELPPGTKLYTHPAPTASDATLGGLRGALPAGLQQIRQDLWNFVVVDGGGRNNTRARNDAYVELGLMERVQRSPALYQLSDAGQRVIDHWRNEAGLPCTACDGKAFVAHMSGDPQDSHRCPECNGTGYAATPPAEHEAREPGICLADIARVRDDDPDNGRWITCSGCHETVDGQDVLGYPYSALLGYTQGSGCHECGGIGAKWDTTNYEEFARFCEERDAKPAEPVAAPAQVTTPTMEACLQVIREVVSDVRHACSVDGYTHAQGRFLHSIADRIEQAALIGGTLRSQGGVAREAEVHPASMYGLVRDKANAIERGREQIVQAAWDTPATWASDPLPVKSGALAPQHGPQATLTEGER